MGDFFPVASLIGVLRLFPAPESNIIKGSYYYTIFTFCICLQAQFHEKGLGNI
jgi:hypothetical protein